MKWYDDRKFKASLANSKARSLWEEKAAACFQEIKNNLPNKFQDESRIGPMEIYFEMGMYEAEPQMIPVDGSELYGIRLKPTDTVVLLNIQGKVLYEGSWADSPKEVISNTAEFFIYLEKPDGSK